MKTFITALVGGITAVVMVGLVGNQSDLVQRVVTKVIGQVEVANVLGASGSRFPNGLSADGTSPSAGQIRGATLLTTGAVTLQSTLAVTGATTLTGATDAGVFTQGGGCTASSTTVATETWSEAFMIASNCYTYSGSTFAAAITITLPATSTMTTLLPNAGDTRQWFYDPSAYAAATTTTFAAGTGIILMEPDGQNVIIAGSTSAATLECIRKANTDVVCTVDEIIDAD